MADIRVFGAVPDGMTDSTEAIQSAVNAGNIEIQNGIFLISSSIKIPSNRTITGKNAVIKLANEVHDNFFRNSDFINGNVNIIIRGIGNFCLDGNADNNDDDYAAYGPVGSLTIYRYQGIAFYKVDTFEVSGIDVVDFSHWFFVPQHCTNGVIKDLYFNYFTVTKNQDGLDIAHGCNNVLISNIKGHTADDLIALWCSNKGDAGVRQAGWNTGSINDITFNDIDLYTTPYHAIVILAGDGNKVYNIIASDWVIRLCHFFAYVGLTGYYDIAPTKDDIYSVTFDNITLLTQADTGAAIRILEDCKDIAFTNWVNSSGKADYSETTGLDVDNFTINGVQQSV